MKIIYNKKEYRDIILTKAMYQKVMLIYDDTVSNIEIMEIYNDIKESCVYNQMHVDRYNAEEIYNGYKLIIYKCSIDSFLKLDINREEFINVYMPTDNNILPYFLSNDNKKSKEDNYLIIKSNTIDVNVMTSICFNKFFAYLHSLFYIDGDEINMELSYKEITHSSLIKEIEKLENYVEFVDIEIIKTENIQYKYLPLLDLMLVDAFFILLMSIKSHSLMLVDVYKSAKEDEELIDKFYAMSNNDSFIDIINLNFTCLYNLSLGVKEKILHLIGEYEEHEVEMLIEKLRHFTKYNNGLIGYLYLYNIFDV